MIKTLGLSLLAGCAIWATPALAQSAASTSSLEIKVRGNAFVGQAAQSGTLYVNGMIDADFDWDAFESELMEQTGVSGTENSEQNSGWVLYPPVSSPDSAPERTPIVRFFEGSAAEAQAAYEYITNSDLEIYAYVNMSMDPTPDTERRAVEGATADAREQAELVALSTGCHLDRLTSVELLRLETDGSADNHTLSLVSQDYAAQRSSRPNDSVPEASLEASVSATFNAQCP
ncbi:SIMPL domain-containing protein [Oceanicaulis sp. MMSF_3324]|uniref:SIMPL domain-containing protein n=1 Tax=Oceanicaulis sp. MMSF_3324 TaxID=3046702 RepID=UPI00273DD4A0|nr:SIMPL domain-containing protein [Oceanicaulis sp. MMSF_3324]